MFRVLLFALLLWIGPLPGVYASAAKASPLIDAPELAALQASKASVAPDRLRVIDIREAGEGGRPAYDVDHIPGALSAPYRQWRGPRNNPGKLPDEDELILLLQRLGIDAESRVVIVSSGNHLDDFGAAARVYWILKSFGVQQPAILNGGMRAWRAAKLPVNNRPERVAFSNYEPRFDQRYYASRRLVEAQLQASAGSAARLIDARPGEFYTGDNRHPRAAMPGTMPGAVHVDHSLWFGPDGRILDARAARELAQRLGLLQASPVITFCNSGHWSATTWFVLHELLGQTDVRMYPESMIEWSRAGLPMQNVPGRARQLWTQLKLALGLVATGAGATE